MLYPKSVSAAQCPGRALAVVHSGCYPHRKNARKLAAAQSCGYRTIPTARTHARAPLPRCWGADLDATRRSLGRTGAGAPCPCVCAGQAKGLQHPPPRSGKFWGIGGKTVRPPPRVIFSPRKATGRNGKTEGLPECEATPAPVDARRRAGVHTRSRGGGRKNLNQEMIA